MNLRKIFNVPDEDQKKLIKQDYERMEEVAKELSSEHSSKERKNKENHNGKCPHCGKSNIVNKIARTQGTGEVSGSFSLGFGSVSGSSSSDTNGVNHCNECGNQWKKYDSTYKWSDDILKQWMKDIIDYNGGNMYGWVERTMKLLQEKDPYAETMYEILDKFSYDIYNSNDLGLKRLRQLYKSVYDK